VTSDLKATLAVFGAIALFTLLLTVATVRWRKSVDAESRALRSSHVSAQCGDLLHGTEFLWAVWQDTTRVASTTLLIRNARDEIVTTIAVPAAPLDGVLQRFDLDGKHYEVRKPSLNSSRIQLCETGDDAVLLSADHETLRVTFLQGDGDRERFMVPRVNPLKRFRPVKNADRECGKLIIGLKENTQVKVLTFDEPPSLLEQVFVLANA
jgi:hypothetical protein